VEVALLDADVLVDYLLGEGAAASVAARLKARAAATSAVVVYELTRGVAEEGREALRQALRGVRVYPLDDRAARKAADLWRELESKGQRIGDRDVLTAAIALTAGLPILTRNADHFRRVPGLRLAR
jgi:predicted nucleic acid-binding protein